MDILHTPLSHDPRQGKKNSGNKKKETYFDLWHHITNNLFIIFILSSLLTIMGIGIAYVYKDIQNDLGLLADNVIDIVSANEEAYILCKTLIPNGKATSYIQLKAALDLHNELRDKQYTLLKQRNKLGKHISYQSYLATSELVCWNDALLQKGVNVCEIAQKDPYKLLAWRHRIEDEIEADKENHQRLVRIFGDSANYFGSFLFFRESLFEQFYQPPNCDMEKIAKY